MASININSEELNIKFNLATELAYEDITGEPFNPSSLIKDERIIYAQLIKIAIACVIANNSGAKTDSDYILYHATRDEVETLITATSNEMISWLRVPVIAEQHTPETDINKDEDTHPNE